MKKSELYRLAQMAVIDHMGISTCTKLDILSELMDKERVEKYVEDLEATKEGDSK